MYVAVEDPGGTQAVGGNPPLPGAVYGVFWGFAVPQLVG